MKNHILSVLASRLVSVPMKTLFSQEVLKWLAGCELPADQHALIESDQRPIEVVNQEINELESVLRRQAWNQTRVRLLMTINQSTSRHYPAKREVTEMAFSEAQIDA